MEIAELQRVIRTTYGDQDRARGVSASFAWFVEEVGELSRAIHREDHEERVEEFSDVLAWLVSLADLCGVDLAAAAGARYAAGCPKCGCSPCTCSVADPSRP